MTLYRELITSRQNKVVIQSDDPVVEQFFADPKNYADSNLNQFNTDRVYDQILESGENLTILDLGANAGFFSLYVQDRAKMVYAIEPTAEHFMVLSALTKKYPNINLVNVALHNNDEPIDFFIKGDNSTMNSTAINYGEKRSVPGNTLNTLLTQLNINHVDFVKCDIEGSEMIALTDETIGEVRDRIKTWFVEVHATDHSRWEENIRENRDELATLFVRQGYQVRLFRRDILYAYNR